MSTTKSGIPTFNDYHAAYQEKDPDKRAIAFALIELKREGAMLRYQTRKAQAASFQAERRRNEEKEARERAFGLQQQRRIEELQAQMRNGTYSTRNRW